MRCHRCVARTIVSSIEIFDGDAIVVAHLCEACTVEHRTFLSTFVTAQEHLMIAIDTTDFDEVGPHPHDCRCVECDPDLWIELRAERREAS